MSKIIGVTCGSFDYIIHDGHLLFLNQCKQLCDILYVALVADETIRKNKNRKPYYCQSRRAENLLETKLVDDIILLDDNESPIVIVQYLPNIYILGKDQNNNKWSKLAIKIMVAYGVLVVSTFEQRTNSTTRLLEKVGYISGVL